MKIISTFEDDSAEKFTIKKKEPIFKSDKTFAKGELFSVSNLKKSMEIPEDLYTAKKSHLSSQNAFSK